MEVNNESKIEIVQFMVKWFFSTDRLCRDFLKKQQINQKKRTKSYEKEELYSHGNY